MPDRHIWKHDHILHAWWADDEGRVLAGQYPSARNDPETTRAKLALLTATGIDTIIDLTEDTEGLTPYAEHLHVTAVEGRGAIKRISHPIPDVSVTTAEHYDRIIADVEAALEAGEKIYIHCWGGVGRTGTVVGIWHVHRGLNPAEALERIAAAREGTVRAHREAPETERQKDAIRAAHARRNDHTPGA
jgi:protein tyrosine/serine phosphatase